MSVVVVATKLPEASYKSIGPAGQIGIARIEDAVTVEVVERRTADGDVLEVAELETGDDSASGHRHRERARRGRSGLCPAVRHVLLDRVGARIQPAEVEVSVGVGQLRGNENVVRVEEVDFPALQAGVARPRRPLPVTSS